VIPHDEPMVTIPALEYARLVQATKKYELILERKRRTEARRQARKKAEAAAKQAEQ